MLTIEIPDKEYFDDDTQRFFTIKGSTLTLEHSLASLSKWEQKWEIPFLNKVEKTNEQTLDYIRCMVVSPENPPEQIFSTLSKDITDKISEYINAKMTATWFNDTRANQRTSNEVVTAEIIYYWMVALNVPFETQYWHLNRLLTLIRVINIKNDPKKKMMPKSEAATQQRLLNEQRRARYNSKG
jgi:hypothetical protein